jgi:hypothetical protein
MNMSETLQSYITKVAGSSASDLTPLAANDTFRRAVDAELSAREAQANAAAIAASRLDDLYSSVSPFASAMGAIRAIAKRFPETSKFMDDAAKSVQGGMGVVLYNPPSTTPVTPVTPPVKPPTPPPAPLPLPTVNATGSTPVVPHL